MPAATRALAIAILTGAAALGGCRDRSEADQNVVITDINAAQPGDIEAVPEDETSAPPATDQNADAGGEDTANAVNAMNRT